MKQSKESNRKRSKAMKRFYRNNPDRKLSGNKNPFYGKIHTEEAKERNREAHLGNKQSKETIEKRKKTIRERFNGGWSRTNNGQPAWNKGKKLSDKHRLNISKAMGKVHADGSLRKKMSENLKGRTLSDEHKRNISKGLVKAYSEGRRPLSNPRRFCTGSFYSKKNGKTIHYRSSYELRAYELLERMQMVFSYKVEPFSITYRKGYNEIREYIPDILVTYINGDQELIEVKPERDLDKDIVHKKIKAAVKYCKINNMEFSVWTEDQVFQEKIREPMRVH